MRHLTNQQKNTSNALHFQLFDHIGEIADDVDCLVTVLIDEVESIASSRSNSARSNEPGDAVRVVNSVLTSLDALRRRPNCLVLCTSNMVQGIDAAFRDRVDLQIYLGPPNAAARVQIIISCLHELMERGIIAPAERLESSLILMSEDDVASNGDSIGEERSVETDGGGGDDGGGGGGGSSQHQQRTNWRHLLHVVKLSEGMSGRGLRKLPLKAHAYYLQRPVVTLSNFLYAIQAVLEEQAGSAGEMCNGGGGGARACEDV